MQKQYNGQNVKVLRSAKQGDPDYDASEDQVIIELADGTEKTVLRSDVTDAA